MRERKPAFLSSPMLERSGTSEAMRAKVRRDFPSDDSPGSRIARDAYCHMCVTEAVTCGTPHDFGVTHTIWG